MSDLEKRIANLTPEKRALLERHLLSKGRSSLPVKLEIRRRGTAASCVLSFAQQRLWFLDQLEPGSPAYNIPLAIRLCGRLNVTALQQSIGEILRRHEVLRTTFSIENDQPVQKTTPATAFILPEVDLSAMQEEQRESKAKQLADEEASRPFDLVTGPLLRAALLRLNPEDHVLLLTMHHIISDGWSMGIFYRELSVLYEAFSKGETSPLPELPIQYADFAVWQREWMQGKNLEEQITFWKEQLRDIATLEFHTDHPRPSVQTFNGAMHIVKLPKDLTEALQGLSRKEGVTLFMTLLTAFQCLLHRYTGQNDIVVGAPIANRNREEIEGLIGFFVNTLVMRADTSGNPAFRELLKQGRKTTLDAYAHQDLPFEKLIMELQPERDLSRNPVFQVMFTLQNVPVSNLELSGLKLGLMGIETTRTRFDLEVELSETMEGLKCTFVYNTNLFERATIERMAGHYQMMLEGIAANPGLRLSELPLLTEAEQHKLLVEWNNTSTDYPRDKCIHELFEEQVEMTPNAIAVVFEDQQLTYRELNIKANQLANYLRKQGVGPEALVGICVERSPEMIIGVLGILKAGGVYVPLDHRYPKERLAFMIEEIKAPVMLTLQQLVPSLPDSYSRVICLDADWGGIEKEETENQVVNMTADNLAYIIYTSGSTGLPKGVIVPHRGVVRLVKSTNYAEFNSDEIFLQLAPLTFDASTFEIWGCLLNGGKLVVFPPHLPSPEELGQVIHRFNITTLWLTAALFHQIVDISIDSFSGIKQMLSGGDVLSVPHVKKFLRRHPRTRLINGYGPTENTTFTCCFAMTDEGQADASVSIGHPISNTQVYILDRRLQPVPVAVPGELYAGGDGLARGYLDRTELTAEKFIPDPFSDRPGSRLYKTGDLARYLPDGNIEFLGRIDNQVKVRGYRIEPGEIETVLRQHPAVRGTVVMAGEDLRGDKRLTAYVVLDKGSAITTNELQGFLKKKLPDYMIPPVFVHLDTLPLTVNGKVDHRALPEPVESTPDTGRTYVAPRNTLEIQLTEIWEKLLGVRPISVRDNFFELGGHSLLAIQMISEIKKIARKNISVMALFHNQTIEQFAEVILNDRDSTQWSSAVPINAGGSQVPLFWVHDTHPARYMASDQPLYVLTHPNKDENLADYNTVEKMAAGNLQQMCKVQPEGPYLIGGFCFWALVALEMADQLIKEGHEVPLLFLVDPPDKCLPGLSSSDTLCTSSRIMYHRKNFAILIKSEKIDYVFEKLASLCLLIRRNLEYKVMKENIKIVICKAYMFFGRPLTYTLRKFYLYDHHNKDVLKTYVPRVYPGRVVIFHSDNTSPEEQEKFKSLATGGVEFHEVLGAKHMDLLHQDAHVRKWAEKIGSYLRNIRVPDDKEL